MCILHYHEAVHCGKCDCALDFDARGRFRCRHSLTTGELCADDDCDTIYAKGGPRRKIVTSANCAYCTGVLQSRDNDKDALAKAKQKFAPKAACLNKLLVQELNKIDTSQPQPSVGSSIDISIAIRTVVTAPVENIIGEATESFQPTHKDLDDGTQDRLDRDDPSSVKPAEVTVDDQSPRIEMNIVAASDFDQSESLEEIV